MKQIINRKKNNKSTPDIRNEMLKKPGDAMLEFVYPLIETVWKEEKIPKCWNKGKITSLWKGKGDKEDLANHRGITTSSSIGTIIDTLIDDRIEMVVPFSQAQGGGKKGASPCEHLFLLRAIIEISKAKKIPTFVTYFDVSKAYDNVCNNDLLKTMWDNGLRGKAWRILRELNSHLTAEINTRFGNTREITMEVGGKQGSRLTGRMFSKMMDEINNDLTNKGFKVTEDLFINVLLWVDDVVSFAVGTNEQKQNLCQVSDFATKHKIK